MNRRPKLRCLNLYQVYIQCFMMLFYVFLHLRAHLYSGKISMNFNLL